ncbi:metalloregulator ArsR/SmtB family transcription factor [Dehalobacter sp. DCM]|uniref:ArsR/SmtB family transcription factor n=1 Tax=Dehalobacter sp. DCM TaxID=2907827 RepID=UPI003081EF2B|nr:metalloregulator ArsR/SmtB family transcription factor [Dehalobacter sp. DCM]
MDEIINLLSILSDKTRLRIVLLLMERELCVCEIFAALNMSQPRVSRQLAILKQCRLIKDRRVGKWIYYHIDNNTEADYLRSIVSLLVSWLKDDPEYKQDQLMVDYVKQYPCCISEVE